MLPGFFAKVPWRGPYSYLNHWQDLCYSRRLKRTDSLAWLTEAVLLFVKTLDVVVVSAAGAPPTPPDPNNSPQNSGIQHTLGKLGDCVIKYSKAELKESMWVTAGNSSSEELSLLIWWAGNDSFYLLMRF